MSGANKNYYTQTLMILISIILQLSNLVVDKLATFQSHFLKTLKTFNLKKPNAGVV